MSELSFDKCPNCGYTAVPQQRTHHNIMNHYVTADGKKTAIIPRQEEEFTATPNVNKPDETVQWIRKDVFDERKAKAAKVPAIPSK